MLLRVLGHTPVPAATRVDASENKNQPDRPRRPEPQQRSPGVTCPARQGIDRRSTQGRRQKEELRDRERERKVHLRCKTVLGTVYHSPSLSLAYQVSISSAQRVYSNEKVNEPPPDAVSVSFPPPPPPFLCLLNALRAIPIVASSLKQRCPRPGQWSWPAGPVARRNSISCHPSQNCGL